MKLIKIITLVAKFNQVEVELARHKFRRPDRENYNTRTQWKSALKEWTSQTKKLKTKLKKLEDTDV